MTDPSPTPTRSLLTDLGWGARVGFLTGLGFSLLALVKVAIVFLRDHAKDFSAELLLILPVYLTAGLIGGLVFGYLRPHARTREGAVGIAMLATIPAMLGFCVMWFGWPWLWKPAHWLILAFSIGLFGTVIGFYYDAPNPAVPLPPIRLRTTYPTKPPPPEA